MCVMSMVHDHYGDRFPFIEPWPTETAKPFIPATPVNPTDASKALAELFAPSLDITELRRLIAEFRELVKAAALIDEKTGQPDCVDPEKEKLQARVDELEKLLASPPEFVVVTGGKVEPGRYRVLDGKLYRAVE